MSNTENLGCAPDEGDCTKTSMLGPLRWDAESTEADRRMTQAMALHNFAFGGLVRSTSPSVGGIRRAERRALRDAVKQRKHAAKRFKYAKKVYATGVTRGYVPYQRRLHKYYWLIALGVAAILVSIIGVGALMAVESLRQGASLNCR